MGLGNNNMPRTRWVGISEGFFVIKDDEGKKIKYKDFTGRWIGFEYKTGEEAKFGTELNLIFQDGGDIYKIGMVLKSGYARSFLRTIENIDDFTKDITLYPQYMDDEKGKAGWFNLFHADKQIKPKYTRKNMGECPEGEQVPDPANEGKFLTVHHKQVAFLRNILETIIAPKLAVAAAMNLIDVEPAAVAEPKPQGDPAPAASAPATPAAPPPPLGGQDEDDLPF